MYTAFYGLREKPFALSPNPRFLFLAESHREALAHLLYGIDQGEGFICVTGEVGTGKTTICRTLLERLGSETAVAFLFNPSRTAKELLQAISSELGLSTEGRGRGALADQLNEFLLARKGEGRRVLLIVDEAQNLSARTLEQIRLLSNLETASSKLIQILLLGQPELDRKLDSAGLRQLRQRISVRWKLGPLSPRETRDYVRYRLRVAAGASVDLFSDAALREVHRRTRGIPRLVNILCDRALLAGFGARARRIGLGLVRQASKEIPDTRRPRLRPPRVGLSSWAGPAAGALALAAALAVLVLGVDSPSGTPPAVASPPPLHGEAPPLRDDEVSIGVSEPMSLESAGSSGGSGLLGLLLSERSASDVRLDAVNAVLDSFGLGRLGNAPRSAEEVVDALGARGLRVLELESTDLRVLRSLNHPVLLPLRNDRGELRLIALRSVAGGLGSVFGATGRGPLGVPLRDLNLPWDGRAYVVWHEFESIPTDLAFGDRGAAVDWLQQALSELGYYREAPSGLFDRATSEGVRALQRGHRLDPSGITDPSTRMVLYSLLDRYRIPRLVESGRPG